MIPVQETPTPEFWKSMVWMVPTSVLLWAGICWAIARYVW